MAAEELVLRGITKHYPGVAALDDVGLTVRQGTIHALAGQNGAGKSTLIKILSGAEEPDRGTIEVGGRQVRFRRPQDAQAAGIQTIHQELSLVPSLSVAENVLLGGLPTRRFPPVHWAGMYRAASAALRRVGLKLDLRRPVSDYSMAEQQGVELAKALHKRARLLLLDEPTSALPPPDVGRLFEILRRLADDGVTMLYISHRMDELFSLCDTVSVLRDGRNRAQFATTDSSPRDVIHAMVGQDLSGSLAEAALAGDGRRLGTGGTGRVLMSVRDLAEHGRVGPISLDLHEGEVLGITGLVGSGQSELASLIAGARRPSHGYRILDGRSLRVRGPRDAIRAGIGLLPQDRKAHGFVPQMSVAGNITLASLPMFSRLSVRDQRKEKRAAHRAAEQLGMRISSVSQPMQTLSGGTQQKAILARWLVRSARVLVCDEPTRGVDVGAKEDMYKLLRDFVRDGGSVIVASSEISEALMCDRVLVMARGQIVAEVGHDQMGPTGEPVLQALA